MREIQAFVTRSVCKHESNEIKKFQALWNGGRWVYLFKNGRENSKDSGFHIYVVVQVRGRGFP